MQLVIKSFSFQSVNYIVNNWKFQLSSAWWWPNLFWSPSYTNGLMVTNWPTFDCHMTTLQCWFLHAIRWQPKFSVARESQQVVLARHLNQAFDGNWRWPNLAWTYSLAFGFVWVHYKIDTFFIQCIFFFNRAIHGKNWESFLKALNLKMPIEKIIVCWISGPNFLEDPNTNSLYIFIFNLTLIYPTFNLN
jgi:hypothetical protein